MGNNSSIEIQNNINLWKRKSRIIQENYCNFLGDRLWNVFTIPDQERLLWSLIAVALYGLPKDDRDDFGLSSKEKDVIDDIFSKCKKAGKHINVRRVSIAVLYITVWIKKDFILITPVFRVKSKDNVADDDLYSVTEHTFIDFKGRVYCSWEDYKNTNTWKGCYVSMPAGAYYSQENRRRCCDWTDQRDRGHDAALIGSVLGATSTVSTLLVLSPVAPAVAVSALIYSLFSSAFSIYRNGSELNDKRKHQESLLSKEAIHNWINLSLGTINLVCGGMALYKFATISNPSTSNEIAEGEGVSTMESSTSETGVSTESSVGIASGTKRSLDCANKFSGLSNLVHAGTGVWEIGLSELRKYKASDLDIRRMRALLLHLYGLDVNADNLREALENISRQVDADTLRQHLLSPECLQHLQLKEIKKSSKVL